MADEIQDYWAIQLQTWTDNGTFDRITAAEKDGTAVMARRSSGAIVIGVVDGGGFAGRTTDVKFKTPEGKTLWKSMRTELFLELNPQFGPHLKELIPESEIDEYERY